MKITVACAECDSTFQTGVENAGRKGKCPRCKAPVQVPAAPGTASETTATSETVASAAEAGPERSPSRESARDRLQRAREKPPLPKLALIVGIACGLWGLVTPFYCIFGLSLIAATYDAFPVVGLAEVLALEGLLGVILLVGGIGLVLRQNWGWWVSMGGCLIGLIDLARIAVPLLNLVDWDHPDAAGVGTVVFIAQGIPALVFVALIVVFLLPILRRYYGVFRQERDRPARKGTVGPDREGRRTRRKRGTD